MSLSKLHQETINDSQMEDHGESHNDEVEGDFAVQESGDEQQAKSCFAVKKNSRTSTSRTSVILDESACKKAVLQKSQQIPETSTTDDQQ